MTRPVGMFDEKDGPPQQVASLAAEKVTKVHDTLLRVRCSVPGCGAELASVRRSPRGLLFRAVIPTSPKELGLLKWKERGKAAGERWQKGITGLVVDLINVDLGPHPPLKVRCRDHGDAVVIPDDLRAYLAAHKPVLPIRPSAVRRD